MTHQTRLADTLREWGLTVVEDDGWRTRGSSTFAPRGVVLHHTAGASSGDMPSLRVLRDGRPDLPGPLAQVGLGRSGTVYVVAAGRSNHAGPGGWHHLEGNASVWGIEAENDGRQPWPAIQIEAMWTAAAALLTLTPDRDPELVALHREWAPGRKTDPHSINGAAARVCIAGELRLGPRPRRVEEEAPMIVVDRQEAERTIPLSGLERRLLLSTDFAPATVRVAIGTAPGDLGFDGIIVERRVVRRAHVEPIEIPAGAQIVSVRWIEGGPVTARVVA